MNCSVKRKRGKRQKQQQHNQGSILSKYQTGHDLPVERQFSKKFHKKFSTDREFSGQKARLTVNFGRK